MQCMDCGEEYGMIMVKDAVWWFATRYDAKLWVLHDGGFPEKPHIFTDDINYCKDCIEKRIGRKLRRSDLMECPVNEHYYGQIPN